VKAIKSSSAVNKFFAMQLIFKLLSEIAEISDNKQLWLNHLSLQSLTKVLLLVLQYFIENCIGIGIGNTF